MTDQKQNNDQKQNTEQAGLVIPGRLIPQRGYTTTQHLEETSVTPNVMEKALRAAKRVASIADGREDSSGREIVRQSDRFGTMGLNLEAAAVVDQAGQKLVECNMRSTPWSAATNIECHETANPANSVKAEVKRRR